MREWCKRKRAKRVPGEFSFKSSVLYSMYTCKSAIRKSKDKRLEAHGREGLDGLTTLFMRDASMMMR